MTLLSFQPSSVDEYVIRKIMGCLNRKSKKQMWYYAPDALLRLQYAFDEREIELLFEMTKSDDSFIRRRGLYLLGSIEANLSDEQISRILGGAWDKDCLLRILHRVHHRELPHLIGQLVDHTLPDSLDESLLLRLCRKLDDDDFEKMCKDLWKGDELTTKRALLCLPYVESRLSRPIANRVLELLTDDQCRREAIFTTARLGSLLTCSERRRALNYIYDEHFFTTLYTIRSLPHMSEVIRNDDLDWLIQKLVPAPLIPGDRETSRQHLEQHKLNLAIVEASAYMADQISSEGMWRILNVMEGNASVTGGSRRAKRS